MVKCLQQDIEKDVHLRRTGRADPTEASKYIVLALVFFLPAPVRSRSRANVCTSMYSILGYRDYGNRLTINST